MGGHVELKGEQTTGRASRTEQEPPAVPPHGDPHDAGREMEEAREPFQVEFPGCRRVPTSEEVDRPSADGRPGRWKFDRRNVLGIDLVMGRKRRSVIGGELLAHQWMIDRRRPHAPGSPE